MIEIGSRLIYHRAFQETERLCDRSFLIFILSQEMTTVEIGDHSLKKANYNEMAFPFSIKTYNYYPA
jgi:hypothetical protein